MKIQILGTGCMKCEKLEVNAKEAAKEKGGAYEIEKVSDIKKIMEYPILTTPGLVIDEKLVVSGRVPSKAEVTTFITNALAKQENKGGN